MKSVTVMLDTITKVKDFVNHLITVPYDVDLVSGKYVIDAKSIMGIFSLDLSKPIELRIYNDDCDALLEKLKPFLA
ncbi:MAG: HPr family phosphocarrier protein [Ruminococcaceae bacterium]|nr:HPr family phosphocarrier protein [Oscillospiraceae bacterium]